ncbi:pyrroline-5-carboxylate reductase [Byssothecium circinans]|uniref:Pyrroline-5-carboxylate reductase n=1 Tax=Byssothecium circinans TaxID=147558 RepID=A0A6A5U6A3_9PLEO|nr:pyrroline-5-carboxylate reductase [Byssothecium circinans]
MACEWIPQRSAGANSKSCSLSFLISLPKGTTFGTSTMPAVMNGRLETLTILGCGALGTAILCGLLDSLDKALEGSKDGNCSLPTKLFACVRTVKSAERLKKDISHYSTPATILHGENVRAVQESDVVLLSCLPHQLEECIGQLPIKTALRGKLLISILAGVTIPDIENVWHQEHLKIGMDGLSECAIVRAMPNVASAVRDSTTVITSKGMDRSTNKMVESILSSVGEVISIDSSIFDACTALCGSCPAFFSVFLEALVDAAVSLGVRRPDAERMAAHTMRGTASMMVAGANSTTVRETVASPGGSTMAGLLELEKGSVRWSISNALISSANAAQNLTKRKS